MNVEEVRNRCGAALARADNVEVDVVSGIPDSGICHAPGIRGSSGYSLPPSVREIHADLAARKAVAELEGDASVHLDEYADPSTERYHAMLDRIRSRLGLTTLAYQRLPDMVQAIGLPKEKLCTFCWDGESA